jgi:single-strand DNA-binding protein
MAYELTGKIKIIQEEQTFDSGFSKREMVVTVEDGNYPQDINLEFVKDKAKLLDDLQPGQEVTVTFDIRGRESNGRYFNNLQGWKVSSETMDKQSKENSTSDDNLDQPDIDSDIPF